MPGDYDIEYASPWAGANYLPYVLNASLFLLQLRRIPDLTLHQNSVAKEGTPAEEYERNTWPELAKLAKDHPEAGVHFQGAIRRCAHHQ